MGLRLVLEAVLRRRKKMVGGGSSSGAAIFRGGGGGGSSKQQRGFSMNPKDYKLMEEIGHGASAVVYRAIYLPTNEVVAIKCLDLDRCNSNLDDIRRESQTMSLIDHPNVIKSFCSFSVDHSLWVVMPFMAQGSCLHLMKTAYSDGFEEAAICCVLKETLKALDYLHKQGHIHRDVKAGNILLDDNGEIKLGDFGVSACLFDNGDRQRSRNTFVGTPCWMAPEVLQPGSGYNSKADIWSFGITALELAHGHAPFSKYPPMKVLLMTIQNAPPGLDYDRDKKFTKSFKEMVAMCLVKDQTKRPTAEKLLKHSCFKNTKPPELSVKKLFSDLPPLWTRVKYLQDKDAAQLALKRMATADEEAISQSEYQRGVSAWNFDIRDLKTQASLLIDDDDLAENREDEEIFRAQFNKVNDRAQVFDSPLLCENMDGKEKISSTEVEEPTSEEIFTFITTASSVEQMKPNSEHDIPEAKVKPVRRQSQSGPLTSRTVLSHSASEKGHIFERSESEHQTAPTVQRTPSFSGPLNLPTRASANSLSAPIKYSGGFRDSLDDKSKANLVQKGRFSVTSGNVDLAKDVPLSIVPRRSPQVSPLRKSASVGNWILEPKMPTAQPQTIKESSSHHTSPSPIMPQIQHLFQQNSIQEDLIMSLLNSVQPAEATEGSQSGKLPPLPRSDSNGNVEPVVSERERLLLIGISELQARLNDLTEELDTEKSKYSQVTTAEVESIHRSRTSLIRRESGTGNTEPSPQVSPLRKSASVGNWILEPKMPTAQPQTIKESSSHHTSPSPIMPQIQHLFQQNSIQEDLIMSLLNSVQPAEATEGSQSGKLPPLPRSDSNGNVEPVVSERERLLLIGISELQARLNDLTEELDTEKSKYSQLQQKLKAFTGREQV